MVSLCDLEKIKTISSWSLQKTKKFFYCRHTDVINDKYKALYLHRFITDCPEGLVVDHIDGNTLDNRRENLRIVSVTGNGQNRKDGRNIRKSKFGYVPAFKVDGHLRYFGTFKDLEEAQQAVKHYRAINLPNSPEAFEQPWYRGGV